MKNAKTLWSSISILSGIVIAILALIRGTWQERLLLGAFIIWALWFITFLLIPIIRREYLRKIYHGHQEYPRTKNISTVHPLIPTISTKTDGRLLLRHVNHRISAYLRSVYPDITWEWAEKAPERLILSGGTGRIRVFGIPDFDHADISFDQRANISCCMIKTVPLTGQTDEEARSEEEALPPNKQPVDPQIWYEIQGRAVLENIVADLNSRGHSRLTLRENGDICIDEGQGDIPKEHLQGFPEKVYWPRLVQVLERNGLAAETTEKGIHVSW